MKAFGLYLSIIFDMQHLLPTPVEGFSGHPPPKKAGFQLIKLVLSISHYLYLLSQRYYKLMLLLGSTES